jgi:hypothetical protein
MELLEKIAGRFGGFAKRIVRARILVGREIHAGVYEIQFVEMAISALKKMRGRIGFHHGSLLRLSSRSIGDILRGNTERRERTSQQQGRGDRQSMGAQFVQLASSSGKPSPDSSVACNRH